MTNRSSPVTANNAEKSRSIRFDESFLAIAEELGCNAMPLLRLSLLVRFASTSSQTASARGQSDRQMDCNDSLKGRVLFDAVRRSEVPKVFWHRSRPAPHHSQRTDRSELPRFSPTTTIVSSSQ